MFYALFVLKFCIGTYCGMCVFFTYKFVYFCDRSKSKLWLLLLYAYQDESENDDVTSGNLETQVQIQGMILRGALESPHKATPNRWGKTNIVIECRTKRKAKNKRYLGYSSEMNVVDENVL